MNPDQTSLYDVVLSSYRDFQRLKSLIAADVLTLTMLNKDMSRYMILFVLLLYVPGQQLWSLRDGQFT